MDKQPYVINKSKVIDNFYYIHHNDHMCRFAGSLFLNEDYNWKVTNRHSTILGVDEDFQQLCKRIQAEEFEF